MFPQLSLSEMAQIPIPTPNLESIVCVGPTEATRRYCSLPAGPKMMGRIATVTTLCSESMKKRQSITRDLGGSILNVD